MSIFLNGSLKSLQAYVPGEQPQDKAYIKLNTNESPYPPTPLLQKKIDAGALCDLRLYPDPECAAARQAVADWYGVKRENVLLTNGSDEALSFLFMGFFENGVDFPDITYGFYKVFGDLYHLDYRELPLTEDFDINPKDYMATGRGKVIANPNAPTGKTLPLKDLYDIADSDPNYLLVIDEAYVDFGGETAIPLAMSRENVVVVGTFSKSRSLAGGRLGFAIGPKPIIDDLQKIRYSTNPYNINRLTLLAGECAMEDKAYFEKNCREIIETRDFTRQELLRRGFRCLPSCANFLFCAPPKAGGEAYYQALRDRGILVRHFGASRIRDFVRVTIGLKKDMEVFLAASDDILKGV